MPLVIPTRDDWKRTGDAKTVNTMASPTSALSNTSLPPGVRVPICAPWTKGTQFMHRNLTNGVTALALQAARRPRTWITVQTLLSLGLLAAGLFSGGFRLELDIVSIFNPLNSKPQLHNDWIVNGEGAFGDEATRTVLLFLHNNGHDVLHTSQTRRVLEAVEVMQSTPGMKELCARGTYLNFDNEPVCRLLSVSGYWNTDDLLADFDARVSTDDDVRIAVASNTFANGSPIVHDALLGNWNKTRILDVKGGLDVIEEEEEAVEELPTLSEEDEALDTDFGSGFATNPRDPIFDEVALFTNSTNVTGVFNQTRNPMLARSSSAATTTTTSSPEFIMSSAQSYFVHLDIPQKGDDSDVVEKALINRLDELRLRWIDEDANKVDGDPTAISMDIKSAYAYQMESMKLIQQDMYLAVCAALVVVVFTCLVFYSPSGNRIDGRNQSRMLMGVASIWTITMSLLAGCGIMFLCGIPYTSVNQMLPYIIYGIGLDDTFIITGAFFQLDPSTIGNTTEDNKDTSLIERKIQKTLQQVGWSISLTTLTTVIAFLLGYFSSSFPGVRWLCLYAVAVITIDFFFQVTYFVAFLVLDEERVQASRRDCCFCFKTSISTDDKAINFVDNNGNIMENAPTMSAQEASTTDSEDHGGSTRSSQSHPALARNKSLPERVMQWYSGFLLRPPVKVTVLVIFTAYFGWCCYSASLLEQHFDLNDYVSDTSYLKTAFGNIDKYSSIVREMQVYFRNVDQTDPEVQRQMIDYINDLESLHQIGTNDVSLASLSETGEVRPFCWVRDFQEWEETQYVDQPAVLAAVANMTFLEKLNFALTDKTVREVYGQDIVRDESGNITASRCTLFLRDLDLQSVPDQIEMLLDQREVTQAQPMNNLKEHKKEWAFFSFDKLFFFWESSAIVIDEMVFTTIAGVAAVAFGKSEIGVGSCYHEYCLRLHFFVAVLCSDICLCSALDSIPLCCSFDLRTVYKSVRNRPVLWIIH